MTIEIMTEQGLQRFWESEEEATHFWHHIATREAMHERLVDQFIAYMDYLLNDLVDPDVEQNLKFEAQALIEGYKLTKALESVGQ
jgi:hypothetical protein